MDMLLRQSPVSLRDYYHFKYPGIVHHVINEIQHAFSAFNIRTQITERHGTRFDITIIRRIQIETKQILQLTDVPIETSEYFPDD